MLNMRFACTDDKEPIFISCKVPQSLLDVNSGCRNFGGNPTLFNYNPNGMLE